MSGKCGEGTRPNQGMRRALSSGTFLLLVRSACLVLALVGRPAASAPRFGAEQEVHPGTERELLVHYTYGHGLTWTGEHWASSWYDVRSGSGALYAALVDADGGVPVEGTRVLLDASEATNLSGATSCHWQDQVLFSIADYSTVSRFVWATPALQRLRLDTTPGGSSNTRVLECSGPRPLWAAVVVNYRSGTPYFSLSVKELDGDGGIFNIDGGALLAPDLDVSSSVRVGPSAAFDGTTHLLVWAAGGLDGGAAGADVWGAFLTPGQAAGAPLRLVSGVGHQADPRVVWSGGQYTLAWTDGVEGARDLYVRRVSSNGATGPITAVATGAADEYSPQLAFDGVSTVLAWREHPVGSLPSTARTATLSNGSLAAGPFAARTAWADALLLAAGPPGQSLLQQRDFGRGIRPVVQRLQGAVAEPSDGGFIEVAQTLRAQRQPSVLGGPGGALVTWTEASVTLARALEGDGGLVSLPEGVRLARRDGGFVGLTQSGSTFSVSWFDDALSVLDGGVTALRSTYRIGESLPVMVGELAYLTTIENTPDAGSEAVLEEVRPDSTFGRRWPLAQVRNALGSPGLARNVGGTLLATWEVNYRVQGACVTGVSGASVTTGPVLDFGAASYVPNTQVAGDGDGFLVVFVVDGPMGPEVRAVRVDASCQPLDATPFLLGRASAAANWPPAVVFDGRQYVVVFSAGPDARGDVVLVRVSRDGSVTAPLLVAADPLQGEVEAKVWADRPGHWLVVYGRFLRDERLSARRLYAVWLTDDALGAACALGTDCESGVCVAGLCCDRPCGTTPDGCEACSVALGGARDGTCGPRASGSVCRSATTACDPVERCDGVALACPTDVPRASGAACSALACAADAGQRLEAACGARVTLPANLVPQLPVAEPAQYSVAACDGGLPSGLALDPATGAASWEATPVPSTTQLVFIAEGATSSAATNLELVTSCPEATDGGGPAARLLGVGCGCSTGDPAWLLGLALLRWRARRAGGGRAPSGRR